MHEKHKSFFCAFLSDDCTTEIFQQQTPGSGNTKSDDRWEFPRHHLKVFNILGEGCFGQVWRCEALDIDGKYKKWLKHVHHNCILGIFLSPPPQTMLGYFIISGKQISSKY